MRDAIKVALRLFIITAVAGLSLGAVHEVTKAPIEERSNIEKLEARKTALPNASEFKDIEGSLPEGIDSAFTGFKDGEKVGYAAQTTVRGYGGEIEIVVGMGLDGKITGVNIGGSDFQETAGLGARAKEPWFSEQFKGLEPDITLNEDVDAITAATITSTAVTDGVNSACDYIMTLIESEGLKGAES